MVLGRPSVTCWILLRGLTREARHWGDFPRTLQAVLPAARIATIDLPGNGQRHAMRSPTRIEAIAADCRAQALAQGLRPPFHLLALSLGAMVAVAWADAHPDEVQGGVLINTSLRPFSPFTERLRPTSYRTLLKLALPIDDRRSEQLILGLTSSRAAELSGVLAAWVAWRREYPVSLGNALRQLAAAARYQAPRRSPIEKLLLLAGSQDALVDPNCSRRLASTWQSAYVEHPRAGHDLPLDDGPWVAEQVRRWLAVGGIKFQ
jgi:pimeloyl-ACP methyl ester carboxylesterase